MKGRQRGRAKGRRSPVWQAAQSGGAAAAPPSSPVCSTPPHSSSSSGCSSHHLQRSSPPHRCRVFTCAAHLQHSRGSAAGRPRSIASGLKRCCASRSLEPPFSALRCDCLSEVGRTVSACVAAAPPLLLAFFLSVARPLSTAAAVYAAATPSGCITRCSRTRWALLVSEWSALSSTQLPPLSTSSPSPPSSTVLRCPSPRLRRPGPSLRCGDGRPRRFHRRRLSGHCRPPLHEPAQPAPLHPSPSTPSPSSPWPPQHSVTHGCDDQESFGTSYAAAHPRVRRRLHLLLRLSPLTPSSCASLPVPLLCAAVVCPHLFAGCHGVCPNAHKQRPIYRKNSSKHIMALHRGCDCKYKSAMRIQEVLKEEEDDDAADSSSTAYMEDEQPQPQPPFQLLPQRQRQEASSSTPGDPLSQSPSPSAADDNGSMLDESGEADDDVKRPGPDKRRNSDIASPLMSPLKVEEVKEGDSLHRGGGGGGGVDAPSTPSTEPRTKKQRVVLVKNSSASVPRSQAKTERTVTISMKKWRSVELKVLTLEERLAQTIGVLDSFLTASRNGGSITATQQAQMHSQLMQTTSSAAASALASAAAAPHQEREEDSAQTTAYPPLRNLAHPLRPPPPPPPPASTSAPPPTAPPSSAPTAAPVPPPPNSLLPPPPPPLPPSSLPLHSSSTPSTIPQSLMPPHPLPPPNLANAPPPRGLHPLALQNSLPPPPPPPPTHLQQLGSSAVSVLPSLDIAAAKQLTQIAGSEADQPGAPVTGGGVGAQLTPPQLLNGHAMQPMQPSHHMPPTQLQQPQQLKR